MARAWHRAHITRYCCWRRACSRSLAKHKHASPPPVYSYCRPGVHLFDPHWESAETPEPGGDPLGTLTRLHAILHNDTHTCPEACRAHVARIISVHVRGRFALRQLRAAGPGGWGVLRWLAEGYPEARGLLELVEEEEVRVGGDYLAGSYLMMLLTRLFDAVHDMLDGVVDGDGDGGAMEEGGLGWVVVAVVMVVAVGGVVGCKGGGLPAKVWGSKHG